MIALITYIAMKILGSYPTKNTYRDEHKSVPWQLPRTIL